MRGILLGLLISTSLFAEVSISSDSVTCEGSEILLFGNVSISHPLAKIHSKEARFNRCDRLIRNLEMQGRVNFLFAMGGELSCYHAFINPTTFEGRFSGLLPLERVTYKEKGEGALATPVSIECDRMDVQLDDGELNAIKALGNVQIAHQHNFTASAREATYFREGGLDALPQVLKGRYQDSVQDVLNLAGNVKLKALSIGSMHSDREIWLVREPHFKGPIVDCVAALGTTILKSCDDPPRTLVCHGELIVDHRNHLAHLRKSQYPVSYSDPMGGFTADEMVVEYEEGEGFCPTCITLSGNVRIRSEGQPMPGAVHIQCAIADKVEYLPPTETMILTADEGGHVLFLDETDDTKISAKKLIINRKEGSFEGVGPVRFTLNEQEVFFLRQLFGFEG